MTSIDDREHGEQEDDEDEWETVWESPYHMQEVLRAQQPLSNLRKGLEDVDRIQNLIDPPALRALRRMDQIAAGSIAGIPAWLENLHRTEDMLRRAQGLYPVRRRKQRVNTPPQREDARAVVPSQTNFEPPKRNRGNPTMRAYLNEEEFDECMHEYVSAMQDLPTQPEFIHYLKEKKQMVLTRWTLGRYTKRYRDWRGCGAHFAHLIRQE